MTILNALLYPKFKATYGATAAPVAGGYVYIYLAGTTTFTDTWSDVGGTTLNTNPVQLDSNGEANIYFGNSITYKMVITDSNYNTLETVDYILPPGGISILPVTKGGTGLATLTAHGIMLGEGTSNVSFVSPDTAGKVLLAQGASTDPAYIAPTVDTGLTLTTNAATLKYGLTIPVVVSSGGTGLTTLTNHSILLGAGTSAINPLAVGSSNTVLHGNTGADPSFSAVSLTTDVTGTLPVGSGGSGTTTLTNHGVLLGAGTSAINPLGVGASNTVLHGNTGADPSFSAVSLTADVTGTLPVNKGGTGVASMTAGAIPIGDGTNPLLNTGVGTAGQIILSGGVGFYPSWNSPTAGTGLTFSGSASTHQYGLTIPVVVSSGGTGLTSTTAYAVLCGGTTSTAALQSIASVGTSGQVLTSNGAGALPTFQAASGGLVVGKAIAFNIIFGR